MPGCDRPSAPHAQSLGGAAGALPSRPNRAVPVTDPTGRLAGIVTPATMTAVLFQHEALDYVRGEVQ